MIRTFAGKSPRIHKTAFIHESCEVIGDVTVGAEVSIWPMAVLRGDVDAIRVGAGTNIQDNAVLHCRRALPAIIGKGVTVGHGAIVHGSKIGDLCLVGMGAIVMEAEIGRECLIAAGALVPKGLKIPSRSLVMGFPAKAVRPLKTEELAHLRQSEAGYRKLARKHRKTSQTVPCRG
ncbi:MAG: gamma carbonic anhydrase family protein [Elusimicrobia bacterium]|nr:gamma carbonic anhydrase family protein [Elusimicrobiota bacterium]